MKLSRQGIAIGAVMAIGASAGVGVALADHFNLSNYPNGWVCDFKEGTKQCFHGCSAQSVSCDAPGKHGYQMSGGSVTCHPKGKGGEEHNPHVFTEQIKKGPKMGPNDKECPQNPNNPDNKKKNDK